MGCDEGEGDEGGEVVLGCGTMLSSFDSMDDNSTWNLLSDASKPAAERNTTFGGQQKVSFY